MACINDLPFEILLKGGSPAQCEALIKEKSDEVYFVPGGYTIRGVLLQGDTIPIGVNGDEIIFQYIRPCFGLFVLKLANAADEVEKLRSQFKKK